MTFAGDIAGYWPRQKFAFDAVDSALLPTLVSYLHSEQPMIR
jgi:hypothetical protein